MVYVSTTRKTASGRMMQGIGGPNNAATTSGSGLGKCIRCILIFVIIMQCLNLVNKILQSSNDFRPPPSQQDISLPLPVTTVKHKTRQRKQQKTRKDSAVIPQPPPSIDDHMGDVHDMPELPADNTSNDNDDDDEDEKDQEEEVNMPDIDNNSKEEPEEDEDDGEEEEVVEDEEDTTSKEEEVEDDQEDSKEQEVEDDNEDTNDNNNSVDDNNKSKPDVLTKHGTGPAKLGYVVDLVEERVKAKYRNIIITEEQLHKNINKAFYGGMKGEPCEYIHKDKKHIILQHSNCRDEDIILIAYNNAPFTRYLCGHEHEIQPMKSLSLDHQHETSTDCTDYTDYHVFPTEHHPIPLDGKDMPIITVRKDNDNNDDDNLENINDCDIPCLWDKDLLNENGVRKMRIGEWKIIQSNANPYEVSQLKIERTDYRRNIYYSTTSMLSSIPLSYYDVNLYNYHRNTKAISYKSAKNKATYLLDTDCTVARRNKWFAAVQSVMEVESYGSCHHNTDLNNGETIQTMSGRIQLMKKNRIILAYEPGNEKDHITNIVWEALMSGSVPAIFGPTNLEQHIPKNSAITSNNFNSWDKFAEYVKLVANNKTLWDTYHTWRTNEEELTKFQYNMEYTNTKETCRVCRWAYAKQYGLGWNHTKQIIQEPKISRTLCVINHNDKLISKPFKETWIINGNKYKRKTKKYTCGKQTSVESTIQLNDEISIKRKIIEHDGIFDITLSEIETGGSTDDSNLILRLEFPNIRNTDGAYFRDAHTVLKDTLIRTPLVSSAAIQDNQVKITILANWVTIIRSPSDNEEGIIEIVINNIENIDDDEIRRIRIIIEDMNILHDKMTEYFPSTYSKMMIQDFVDPLEYYYEA